MDMGNGTFADRTIHIFLPTIREEIQSTKNELTAYVAMMKANNPAKEAEYLAAAPQLIKAKYKMLLTHEMVHIFATDEYRGPLMAILGLDILELLTDSINLVAFYPDYKKAGFFAKAGVAEGVGYLVNLLRAEQPERNFGPDIVDVALDRAKKIIQQCRQKMDAHQSDASGVVSSALIRPPPE
jgi:hypothetical protein